MMRKTALLLCLTCGALPAPAQQSPNDIQMLQKYAGTWAVDCAKPGTRLGVEVRKLTLQSGGKQMTSSTPPMAAFSWFGQQQPPAGFEAALLADAQNAQLVFFAMGDRSGPYLTVEADGPTLKQFGKPALAGKFRRCP
ncbi:MAG TPA: hypothetical protein PKB14_09050 [Rubrivivax sp.]|nr:hypothetical protein [Rubrivivax sp.]